MTTHSRTSGHDGFRADGCRVFAGVAHGRPGILESLGREVTQWLADNPRVRIVHLDTTLQPAEGRVWMTIVLFFAGRTSESTAASNADPAGVAPANDELAPDEAARMREAAAELFGPEPVGPRGRGQSNGEPDSDEDDDDSPLDLPPASDEPLDIRPL